MRRSGRLTYGLGLVLLLFLIAGQCNAQRLWSQVRLNRTATYVNQPVEVSITVYTSTWFTSGLDPGNIKVNGAFTTYFRPVSTSFIQDGQNYAGIQLIYHVFPFEEKDVVFPSLTLEVETPPDGDFRGVKRTLKSQERIIKVRPIPPGFSKSDWLVANGLRVTDHWSKSTRQVKVGDVLERRITRTAYGTVAELIPPIQWDTAVDVSMYPSRGAVNNYKSKTAISASRTETMRYLFEAEGEVTLPEMVFTWYHPYRKKLYKKTLKAVTFEVAPNPDLGMLASVRDSLLVQKKQEEMATQEDQPFEWMGMSWQELVKYGAAAILFVYLVILLLMKVIRYIRIKRKAYVQSEAYYFHLLKKAISKNNRAQILQSVYRWLDELESGNGSLLEWASVYGSSKLQDEVQGLEMGNTDVTHHWPAWRSARKKYFHQVANQKKDVNSDWINP